MRDAGRYVTLSHTVAYDSVFHTDFRMQLSATDYGNFLANEPSPISTSTISEKATQVLVDQFNYLRSNATEPLSKFLDYLT
jgi:V-type H+-transporting ATPase subunit d